MLKSFYFSFVDREGGGAHWLGGMYVKGTDLIDAVRASHEIGQNPGGELLSIELHEDQAAELPLSVYDKLYKTTEELQAALAEAGLDSTLTRGDGSPL